MSCLFHPILKIAREFFVEEDNELARRQSIFRAAKAEYIYASLPGDCIRRGAKRCDSIGKTRAVHVKQHFVRARKGAHRFNLSRRINGSELGSLCDADDLYHVPVQ